jgi:hypothetical protein
MHKQDHSSKDRKSGQAIIFLIMVLFIGTIVVLWNFDLHNIVSTKVRIDTAADAASLSAARWQGITLNMMGELNLVQAAYICDEISRMDLEDMTEEEVEAALTDLIDDIEDNIVPLRRRLALCGPLMGYVAAQSSALLNLKDKDVDQIFDTSSDYLAERGNDFEDSGDYYMGVVEAPYEGAWEEYGALLSAIAENDMPAVCATTDPFLFYNSTSHPLLKEGFYEAVNGEFPCYFNSSSWRERLQSYVDYTSWDELPELKERAAVNSEYFGTAVYEYEQQYSIHDFYSAENGHISSLTNYYTDVESVDSSDLEGYLKSHLEETSPTDSVDLDYFGYLTALNCTWHYYQLGSWFDKNGYESGKYFPDSEDFPFEEGWKFKDWYNYGGADATVDVRIESSINTPGMQIAVGDIYWRASAKPFGYLEDPAGTEDPVAPMYYGLVLPAFHDVRLFHSSLSRAGSSNSSSDWNEHIYSHLPAYLEGGTSAIEGNGCSYCEALIKWDETDFRERVIEWLDTYGDNCDDDDDSNNYSGSPMGRG